MSSELPTGARRATDFSIVILTFQREQELYSTLHSLDEVASAGARIIVIDNGANPKLADAARNICESVEIQSLPENLGVAGRNVGFEMVKTRYIISLDDDVRGITLLDLEIIRRKFESDESLAALCFHVVDASDQSKTINWCHHRELEKYRDREFITDEITEGAVAFKSEALFQTELYPEDFFISHEGPALAIQLMNLGYMVRYTPSVLVLHSTAPQGRPGWRRYYYDTRNVFWLAVRYLPLGRGMATVIRGVGAMFVYSIRDGHFVFWWRGFRDGVIGLRRQFEMRIPPSTETRKTLKQLSRERPPILSLIRKRLFQRRVQI